MGNGIKDLPQSLISSVRETLSTNQDLKHEDLKRRYPFAFEKKEEPKQVDEETLTQEDDTNPDNVIVERKVRKGKNNCWKIDSWDCQEDFESKKAPRVDYAFSQKDYNTLMGTFRKQGRFWEGTLMVLQGELVNEKITVKPDDGEDFINELDTSSVRKAGAEVTKIDSKIGAMVSKGNLPSKKDLKKLSSDARDDIYMVLAKHLGPEMVASKYGVDLDEAAPEHNEDGRGKFKVNYVSPDGKNIGNDRFETKAEANRFAASLKKKGYQKVSIGEENYMEVELTDEILENESWGDILEINKDTPGVKKQEKSKKSYASGYDHKLKLILRGPSRNTPQEAKQDAAKLKQAGYESVTVHVNGEMKEEKDEDMKDDNKDKDDKKGLDKVDKKEVKKDFDDREDKDIDNDGDSDDSDEFLHKRRKAVSKAIAKRAKKED